MDGKEQLKGHYFFLMNLNPFIHEAGEFKVEAEVLDVSLNRYTRRGKERFMRVNSSPRRRKFTKPKVSGSHCTQVLTSH